MRVRTNAQQQVTALLSFKEALCTDKCAIAITNVLANALAKEREEQREETKMDIATCYSYIRRLLQIDAMPNCSPPGEVIAARSVHNKTVVHLRAMLLTIPTTCADIFARYNDDWLNDVILIVFFTLRYVAPFPAPAPSCRVPSHPLLPLPRRVSQRARAKRPVQGVEGKVHHRA